MKDVNDTAAVTASKQKSFIIWKFFEISKTDKSMAICNKCKKKSQEEDRIQVNSPLQI